MKEILTSSRTGDSCIHVKHKSGLDIYICEMKGFSSIEALFGTKYGSVNTMFRNRDDREYTVVPEGIAHFLEHKLFENEDCGVFELYAATGASGNAFTSFDKTCYTFSCSKNYQENLKILLDFVQKPYFTRETVEKELGIIGQEIQMTNDNPDWRVFFGLLNCMYHTHPVKIDIAGTQESIAQITPELLYKCYDSFYNLNNMVLSIAGNIRADEVLAICDEYLKPCEDKGLETVFADEPDTIVRSEYREKDNVGASIFNMGWKCSPCSGMKRLRKILAATMAGIFFTDVSSEMYQELLRDGIINSTFSYEVFSGDGYFSLVLSGESEHPDIVRESIIREKERLLSEGIPEKDLRRFIKGVYADLVCELNNVELVANLMLNSHMDGISPYDTIDEITKLTTDDVLGFIKNELNDDKLVLSVIERIGEQV
ncbi:MAG: insulinase family protein [Ruminococcus sp.]|nr:insulinase family protein [Ruminococcus sp.]